MAQRVPFLVAELGADERIDAPPDLADLTHASCPVSRFEGAPCETDRASARQNDERSSRRPEEAGPIHLAGVSDTPQIGP
jgi:hypothetical protein